MSSARRAATILALALLAGCATPTFECPSLAPECTDAFAPCEPVPEGCRKVPPGASHALVEIDSSPTTAAIYLDGEYIGETPLRYPLSYTSLTGSLTLVAEPLYPAQTRQERQLRLPPLPRRIQFYMNNPRSGDTAQEETP